MSYYSYRKFMGQIKYLALNINNFYRDMINFFLFLGNTALGIQKLFGIFGGEGQF